jgi:Ca2+-binding RTX toxin-like protein
VIRETAQNNSFDTRRRKQEMTMKSRKSTTTAPRGAAFESLEGRQLFSASLFAGTLTVNGSAGNDVIQVSRSVGPLFDRLDVIENGFVTGSFATGSVSSIQMYGNAGNDVMAVGGGVGAVYMNGGDGNDYLYGGDGSDTLDGWNGDDYISGGNGNDSLWGYAGNDQITGGAGNDSCMGENGSDTITGGAGNDNLYGGNDNDYFFACDGTGDYIDGGAGWDTAQVDKREWWEPWAANDSVSNVEFYFEP